MSEGAVYLKPKKNMLVTLPEDMIINEGNTVAWDSAIDIVADENSSENDKIKAGTVSLSGSPFKKWKIDGGTNKIDKEKIEDILILIKYKINSFALVDL